MLYYNGSKRQGKPQNLFGVARGSLNLEKKPYQAEVALMCVWLSKSPMICINFPGRLPPIILPASFPTGPFTILEPQDPEIDEFYVYFTNVVRQILKLQSCEKIGRVEKRQSNLCS